MNSNKPNENKSYENKPDENKLKKELEFKGLKQVQELKNNSTGICKDNLISIMQSGFDEFKKETGRQMTYSEMRELYG
jgi:hypothetical protein